MQKTVLPLKKPVNHTLEGYDYEKHIDIYTIDTKHYQDVWLTPSGVAFKGLKMLPDTYPLMEWAAKEFRKIMYVNFFTRLRHYLPKNENYLLAYNIWTVGNSPSAGYYHWVAESMPRIMANFDNLPNLSLLLPERAKKVPFIQDSLPYFPFKDVVYIPEKRLVAVPNLWATSYVQSTGGFYEAKWFDKLRNFLWEKTSHVSSAVGRRIYVSRAKARARKLINEQEITPILKEFGFDIAFFEDLTFPQQIASMRNASHFITLHGAALTNMLFMTTQTTVMELMRKTHPFFMYMSMSNLLNLNYYLQFCAPVNDKDIFDVADVRISPQEFRRNLEVMFS